MRRVEHQVVRSRFRAASLSIFTLLAVFIVATSSWAIPTIDFFVTPGTGLVAYEGTGGPMLGAGIGISAVLGTDTVAPPFPFACIDCTMTFLTGPLIAADDTAWVFDATGPGAGIVVSGSVDINGDGVGDIGGPAPFELLSGVFLAPTVTVDLVPSQFEAVGITEAVFLDVKSPALAGFYGLPPFPFVGELTLGWGGIGIPPGGFAGQALEGIVRNRVIPEPTTLALLGVGLFGVLGVRRTRPRL